MNVLADFIYGASIDLEHDGDEIRDLLTEHDIDIEEPYDGSWDPAYWGARIGESACNGFEDVPTVPDDIKATINAQWADFPDEVKEWIHKPRFIVLVRRD